MIKVSEFFKEERLRKGLTIDQVAKATKIRPAFLTAIENGEYHKLPSSAYATGFVRNYAQFLGLSQNRMLALFRREYAGEKTTAVLPAGFSSSSDFPGRFFKLQQKIGLAALLFLAIFIYLFFQYRYAFFNPPLTITTPKENAVVNSQTITVSGKTDPNATVTLNTEPVSVSDDGTFTKSVTVFSGKTALTITVVNHFGKKTILTRHVTVSQ